MATLYAFLHPEPIEKTKDVIISNRFKDEDGKKIRRNEALTKNYLVGNYGGIPALKPLVMLGRSSENAE